MENRRIPCDEVPGGCILTCCAHANGYRCLELVLLSTCYTRFLVMCLPVSLKSEGILLAVFPSAVWWIRKERWLQMYRTMLYGRTAPSKLAVTMLTR
jgi:hypothetical protein